MVASSIMAAPDQLAVWRRQYQEIHELMEKNREQFIAWSEEVAMIEGENQTGEFRRCVVEIKTDLQHYHEVMAQLPNVEEFTDENIERRSGKVFQLFDVVWEVNTLKADLSRKFEKLHLLLK
jgi:hypothetical protein